MLKKALATLAIVCLAAVALPGTAFATNGTDDYPYKTQDTHQIDPWGFNYRQCVSFVAWRLNKTTDGTSFENEYAPGQDWGDANNWDTAATAQNITISDVPVVGAVAQWNEHQSTKWTVTTTKSEVTTTTTHTFTAGPTGHVAYVDSVNNDGTVSVEQYNADKPQAYSLGIIAYKDNAVTHPPRFLYIGVSPPPPSPTLSQKNSNAVVTLTLNTLADYEGKTVYFFRRSGKTGQVVPYGTGTVSSVGSATRTFNGSHGQILSVYGMVSGAPKPYAYSNTIAFKIS